MYLEVTSKSVSFLSNISNPNQLSQEVLRYCESANRPARIGVMFDDLESSKKIINLLDKSNQYETSINGCWISAIPFNIGIIKGFKFNKLFINSTEQHQILPYLMYDSP